MVVLQEEYVREIVAHMESVAAIKPTEAQVQSVVGSKPQLVELINDTGVLGDTDTRDQVTNAFAQEILGRDWPIYGEGLNMLEFFSKFWEAARVQGYEVTGTLEAFKS